MKILSLNFYLIVFLASCSLIQEKKDLSNKFYSTENEALTEYGSMGAGTYEIKSILTKQTEEKICFFISLKAINELKFASFKEWKGKVFIEKDERQSELPFVWNDEALESIPIIMPAISYHGKSEKYVNEGVGCIKSSINTPDFITIKFFPSYIQWPFDGSLDLRWNFTNKKSKSSKKLKERYRGW